MNEDKALLQDILNELQNHRGLSVIPNLEYETYEIEVPSPNKLVTLNNIQTKAEHDRLLGVFGFYKGNGIDTIGSKLRIMIGNRHILSTRYIDFSIIEKTNTLSIEQSAVRLDVPVSNTDVKIEYIDGDNIEPPYRVFVVFILRKKDNNA